MRVLGLDVGEKRIGVALGDLESKIATPLTVLDAAIVEQLARPWKLLIEDWEPTALVVGLPLSLDGTRGAQATRICGIAEKLADACGLPLYFVDERLSSSEAKRVGHTLGLSERDMRGKLDAVAASIFLQAWLDTQK